MSYIALDQRLIDEFFLLYTRKPYNYAILEKLMRFIHPFYVTLDDLRRAGLPDLAVQRASSTRNIWIVFPTKGKRYSSKADAYADIVENTKYKLMLTYGRAEYDFTTIDVTNANAPLKLVYSGKAKGGEKRDKYLRHIKSLIKAGQKSVAVYDKYFDESYTGNLISMLQGFKGTLFLYILADQERISHIKSRLAERGIVSKIMLYDKNAMHDRYILIDNKIEILLSSGFEYLFTTEKDLTYVVRELQNPDSHGG